MNKTQMRQAVKALTHEDGWYAGFQVYNVPKEEVDAWNPRFKWLIDNFMNDPAISNGLVEASMLLSEASRKDFRYQEERNG